MAIYWHVLPSPPHKYHVPAPLLSACPRRRGRDTVSLSHVLTFVTYANLSLRVNRTLMSSQMCLYIHRYCWSLPVTFAYCFKLSRACILYKPYDYVEHELKVFPLTFGKSILNYTAYFYRRLNFFFYSSNTAAMVCLYSGLQPYFWITWTFISMQNKN